MNVVW